MSASHLAARFLNEFSMDFDGNQKHACINNVRDGALSTFPYEANCQKPYLTPTVNALIFTCSTFPKY